MDFRQKADSVAEKMNKITEKFKTNLDTADEMVLTGDDIEEYVEENTKEIELYTEPDEPTLTQLVNLQNLLADFKYLRETLRENTDNGRKIINDLSVDILKNGLSFYDPEGGVNPAELVSAFAELNKALMENMKLYINSYKEMSNIIMNLEKIKNGGLGKPSVSNSINISNVNTGEDAESSIVNVAELIKQLRSE
jgi:hypothetical protein